MCRSVKTLVLGAGNLLLGDEGFGVHFIRHLERSYRFPPEVELLEAGTSGLLLLHRFEAADRVYVVDAISAPGEPGDIRRFRKEEFMLNRLPVKLSPHQAGVQEVLLVSELRGRCPREIWLFGIIPANLEAGTELSSIVQNKIAGLASELAAELGATEIHPRVRY